MLLWLLPALIAAHPHEVAVLSTDGDALEVRWQPLTTPLAEPLARLPVVADESFHGATLPSRALVVVRVPQAQTDLSFAATCSVIVAGQPERVLADQVVRASRPFVIGERVFVTRGRPGLPSREAFRVDALTITELDWKTGRQRSVLGSLGFWSHLAGAIGRELIVYSAGPSGARLEAVHIDTLAVRTLIAAMPALAHDFAIDAAHRAVFFTITEPAAPRWRLDRVAVDTGARSTLVSGPEVTLLPTVLPRGLAWSPAAGGGLRLVGTDSIAVAAQGPGFERVQLVHERLAFVRHEVPGEVPLPLVIDLSTGRRLEVALPRGVVEFIGAAR